MCIVLIVCHCDETQKKTESSYLITRRTRALMALRQFCERLRKLFSLKNTLCKDNVRFSRSAACSPSFFPIIRLAAGNRGWGWGYLPASPWVSDFTNRTKFSPLTVYLFKTTAVHNVKVYTRRDGWYLPASAGLSTINLIPRLNSFLSVHIKPQPPPPPTSWLSRSIGTCSRYGEICPIASFYQKPQTLFIVVAVVAQCSVKLNFGVPSITPKMQLHLRRKYRVLIETVHSYQIIIHHLVLFVYRLSSRC